MSDIKVERFEVDVFSNGQTYTLTNDVGNIANAFVRILSGTDKTSGGPTGSTGNTAPNGMCVGVQITGTSQLTFYLDASNTAARKVIGEVWRYVGPVGGEYEFVVNERGSVTIGSGAAQATASLGITNRNNCIPIYTGYTTSESSTSNYERTTLALHLNSSGDLNARRNTASAGATVTAYYEIPEFTGSAWNVGHAVSSSHDTSAETVTMNTDSTGIGGSTFDVTDWGTATILDVSMEGDNGGETGLSDVLARAVPGGSTTQITFSLQNGDGNARNDGTAYMHILQADNLIVNRTTSGLVLEGSGSFGTPLSLPAGTNLSTPLEDLSLSEWFPDTSGVGTAHGRGRLQARIADNGGYEIQHWIHRSGNNVVAAYGVADFSNLIGATAQRRIITIT